MAHIETNDGYRLHYQEAGEGRPLVMIHGWSQSGAMFRHQLAGLSDRYRVIALDLRGHGESDKPDHGYRVARLAKDVYDALAQLGLGDVTILGWSMGCSVIWSYLDLFGPERLAQAVLVDQMASVVAMPGMTEQDKTDAGTIFDAAGLAEACETLQGPEGVAFTESFVGGMVTPAMAAADKAWIMAENFKMSRAHAARLLYDHGSQDWRDVIRRMTIPTLIIGAKTSLIDWRSQLWIQAQVPESRVEIFAAEEGGNHFMFFEAPEKFNQLVAEFMG